MKKETAATRNMMLAFGIPEHNADAIVGQSKVVLQAVRSMYWRTRANAEIMEEEAVGKLAGNIGAALLFLSDLAPLKEQQDFEQRITRMFENQTIIGVLEKVQKAIKTYPVNGELYYTILSDYYFAEQGCPDSEIFERNHLERTVYYQRKREAVLLFGLQLHAYDFAAPKGKIARNRRRR